MASKASQAPATVAEGLGNVLREISNTLQAPDATQYAGQLIHLQTTVLDMVHGHLGGKGGQQGQQAPGAPAGGAPSPQPPGGAAGGLMGGLSGMMGSPQGPSSAVSGGGPSLSGMDPEQMRQQALVGADQ